MKMNYSKVGLILFTLLFTVAGCIAQKTLSVTFTESGKGAGIQSGLVEKTATTAPATVSSIANTIGSAVTILEFTVKENGSKDGYPLQIKELRFINTGTGDAADFRFILEGPGSNNTVGSSSGQTVVFKEFGDIIVPDGDTTGRTYQVKVHVRSNIQGSTEDNQTILLKTSPVSDFDVAEASSNFLESVVGFQQSPATAIAVLATDLRGRGTFQIGSVARNTDFAGSQSIYAEDENGRLDKDFVGEISIHPRNDTALCPTFAAGSLSSSDAGITVVSNGGIKKTAAGGIATWVDLKFDQILSIRISATASGISRPECTAAINVTGP